LTILLILRKFVASQMKGFFAKSIKKGKKIIFIGRGEVRCICV